jgi:capsular exopolysaccharide synthesis family protein
VSLLRSLAARLRGGALDASTLEGSFEHQFNRLRHSIQHHARVKSVRSVLVTSAVDGEGKSTVALGLARAFARSLDHWALLVETDLRRPTLASRLGVASGPGLVGYLCDGIPLPEVIQATDSRKLSTIFAGRGTSGSTELLSSAQMRRLVEELQGRYPDRMIVFDAPPVLVTPEPLSLAMVVDGVLLVVRADRTSRELVRRAYKALPPAKVLGAVLNGARAPGDPAQYGAFPPATAPARTGGPAG